MAEYEVLHSEPRYKVDSLAEEITGRFRRVLDEMGPRLVGLIQNLCVSVGTFRESQYLITFDQIRIVDSRWLAQDGKLMLTFALGDKIAEREVEFRHKLVDNFVEDTIGTHVPETFRDECSDFLRAMIFQFSMIAKHALSVSLRSITFDAPEWINDRQMLIGMRLDGHAFTPREARL